MARHFEAAATTPLKDIPSVRGGRIEIVGETGSIFVGVERQCIGRAAQCALVVDDPSVSALHAEVRATPEGVHLLDLRSRNGTFVGGNRIVEMFLTSATDFACGRRWLRFLPLEAMDAALEEEQAPARFGPLAATTPRMREVVELLRKYAPSDVSIVITGETGTGKEVVARAVHEASPRRAKPFVGVNCGAMPENLLEDELFGHVKGAFTGADRDRDGLFVQADGGTLLFDELAEMSPGMQAKLLRVLEESVVRPVGSARERKVNVRVLAATHASLEAEVNRGAFRQDLYFRICQLTVALPALRERVSDLPLLVQQILAELGRPDLRVDGATLSVLQARSWPGNVRELRNFLAVGVAAGATEGVLSLDDAFRSAQRAQLRPQVPLESVLRTMRWPEAKKELKRRYWTPLWSECRGNVTQIAKRSGMQRKAVRDALREVGLDVDDRDDGDLPT